MTITMAFSVDYWRENLTLDPYEIVYGIYKAPAYHLILEVVLLLWILKLLFFTKSFKPGKQKLTEQEKEDLIQEWQPEPLVPPVSEQRPHGYQYEITGTPGKTITINGRDFLNMSTLNFLGMIGNKDVEKKAIDTLRIYGVGSCGPRGFYGTVDVHLDLEKKLAAFMNCEEAILYSYGFSTIASAIPAYAKRGDVIFVDEGVCFPIQKGLEASRSTVRYFKHNDIADLERLLQEQESDDRKNPRKAKATRRFLVVEGIYMNYGDIAPLPQLINLKYKYKLRLFIEESLSFGVLGDNGKGITEYYNCLVDDVDLIAASLENAIGSVGGFCCGKSYIIDHQRLSGIGYCFSASLPPMLASGAITALSIMQSERGRFAELRNKSQYLNGQLRNLKGLSVISHEHSPIQHLVLSSPSRDRAKDSALLDQIVDRCKEHDLALTQARYLDKFEVCLPQPSIRISLNVELDKQEISEAVGTLRNACEEVF